MILEKAVDRLRWSFSRNKAFKPNHNDIEALNSVFEWIASQKKINVLNQDLFAKLYIERLVREIRDSKTSIFNNLNQKEVSRLLSMPLEVYYKAFYRELHHNQLVQLFEEKKITEIKYNELKEKYDYDMVVDKLNHMVSEAINKFS